MMGSLVIGVGSVFIIVFVLTVIIMQRRHRGTMTQGNANVLASSLRDEKMKSDIILNAIEDGVVLLDDQMVIQLFNPAAASLTGWPVKEASGLSYKSVLKLVDEKGQPYGDGQDPFIQAFTTGNPIHIANAALQTRSETSLSMDLRISPLKGADGSIRGAVGVFRDVSQQRKEEAQRADFISTASHEMRTPVAAIEGYLALALNEKVSNIDQKARGFLTKAHESTQHLGQLFQDLLTSAKAEDGRLTNHPKVVEMGTFVESLADGLKFSAQKKGLAVEFILGAAGSVIDASDTSVIKPLYYAHVDPDRMREVITNIFDNAVKYTEKGKVSIGLTGDEKVLQIRVNDTGNGIPSEDIPHLFQKFYRVDNSSTRTIGGTGLGLFICRKIVEMYGGRIWVESVVGKGTTFFINVPRLPSDKASALMREEATQLPNLSNAKL